MLTSLGPAGLLAFLLMGLLWHLRSRRLLGVQDLPTHHPESVIALRRAFPILVIDDKPFAYENLLRDHDFNLKVLRDLHDLNQLAEYAIIVCDIQGVGSTLDPKRQGAHIIKEARKRYPTKYILKYSEFAFDSEYDPFFKEADITIKKDEDPDRFVDILDQCIQELRDPRIVWNRMRKVLLARGVSTEAVAKLEDAYVRAIRAGKDDAAMKAVDQQDLKVFSKEIAKDLMKEAVKTIIKSVAI